MPRVKVQFKYHQNCHPKYANAALVNPMDDDIIIEFGFVDPLGFKELKQTSEEEEEEMAVESQPLARLIISPTIAKQLITDLQEALNLATDKLDKPSAYPEPKVVEYMEHQSQLFEEKRKELLNQYAGMYVIFEDGQVLDADKDEAALVKRAYSETGPRHLFIKKVLTEDPKLTINVPSLSK